MIDIKLGDCLTLFKDVPDNSIDTIVTSPPYNKSHFSKQQYSNQIWKGFNINYNTYEDNLSIEEYEEFCLNILKECYRVLKPNGSCFWSHKPVRHDNTIYHPLIIVQKSKFNLYQEIIWDRSTSPNIRNDLLMPSTERIYWLSKDGKPRCYRDQLESRFWGEVWKINIPKDKNHPAPYPQQLSDNCILLTTKENDMVLDPFMGSGTTAISCYMLNRNCIGFEIDSTYHELSLNNINRLRQSDEFWR